MKRISDKASWRLFVVLPIVIFAAGMIVMVTISMTRNVDLVAENYYERELKYQQEIDLKSNSADLDNSIRVEGGQGTATIICGKPELLDGKSGEVILYRPSDASIDFKSAFLIDSEGKQVIKDAKLRRGLWKLKISLTGQGKSYSVEKSVFVE